MGVTEKSPLLQHQPPPCSAPADVEVKLGDTAPDQLSITTGTDSFSPSFQTAAPNHHVKVID